jgi:hypothetical protein
VLNGQTTVDIEDAKFASGPIALQWGRGIIKFRKVQIRELTSALPHMFLIQTASAA